MSRCQSQHRLRCVDSRSNFLSLLKQTLVSNSNKLTVPSRKNLHTTNTFFFSLLLRCSRASVAFGNGLLLFCRSRDRRVGRVLHLMFFFFVCRTTTRRQVVLAIGVRRSERVHANHESRPCERCMSFFGESIWHVRRVYRNGDSGTTKQHALRGTRDTNTFDNIQSGSSC